ncbi:plasmid mobilization protein [Bernardetia sp.]|uniref:plasmid mobilization protein n=1 Tax=Bernardetia sp. TaxID=1937974 RepID=UPI0025C2A208|nr:plasmid mobilization relaxosome protein MobC [Bernardetia sp.]
MMKFPTLQEYLQSKGVSKKTSKKKIEKHKETYKKLYRSHYYKTKEANQKAIKINPTFREYQLLCRVAKEHKKRVSTYVREAAIAYSKKEYIAPDESLVYDLIAELNSIGSNINQVVHQLHAIRAYNDAAHYEKLLKVVKKCKQKVNTFLTEPPEIEEVLSNYLSKNPSEKQRFLELIERL